MTEWLREMHPTDVLMPLAPDTKRPAHAHAHGAWSWTHYDRAAPNCADGLAVLVKRLCVVDVDSLDHALQMEGRHAALGRAPCSSTPRGRHYWFARSERCEVGGYFDGASQVQRGVDFKTVCSTGTGGVVAIPPAEGREWLPGRAPWQVVAVEPIPDDLLDAVARPTRVPGWLTVECAQAPCAGARFRVPRDASRDFSYFDLADDARWSSVPLPVRGTRAKHARVALLAGTAGEERRVSRADLAGAMEVADMLGANERAIARLRALAASVDEPPLARAAREEDRASAVRMVELTRRSALVLRRAPATDAAAPADLVWLMRTRPRGACAGLAAVSHDPARAVERTCGDAVMGLLRAYPERLVVAGGSVLGAVACACPLGSDIDIFVVGAAPKSQAAMVRDVLATMSPVNAMCTPRALTMYMVGGGIVQLIFRHHARPRDVMYSFDLSASQVGAWVDARTGALRVFCSRAWAYSVTRMAIYIDPRREWSPSTMSRLLKYHSKGFDVCLLGVRRGDVRPSARVLSGDGSLGALLAVEEELLASRVGRRGGALSIHRLEDERDAVMAALDGRVTAKEARAAAYRSWRRDARSTPYGLGVDDGGFALSSGAMRAVMENATDVSAIEYASAPWTAVARSDRGEYVCPGRAFRRGGAKIRESLAPGRVALEDAFDVVSLKDWVA
jgi:hypothetical protein